MTPMMQQYFNLKNKVSDSILFFRMGDFYEIFDKDAELVAPLLGIVLTSRDKDKNTKIPFCGVPHHSAKNYWSKLIKMGFKIAIADQLENPSETKGIVKRDIVKILTPANIEDIDLLDQNTPNYAISIYEEPQSKDLALCLFDTSTGEIRLGNILNKNEIKSFCLKYKPKQILVRKFFQQELKNILEDYLNIEKVLIEPLPESILRDTLQQDQIIKEVFGSHDLQSFPCGNVNGGKEVLSATILYLKSLYAKTEQFLTIKCLQEPNTMILDEIAQRDLELFESISRHNLKGSLFAQLNYTSTPMGARLLKRWLAHPLLDYNQIIMRHNTIEFLLKIQNPKLENLKELIKGCPDLERLVTRIINGYANPIELSHVRESLVKAKLLVESLSASDNLQKPELLNRCLHNFKHYYEPLKILCESLTFNPSHLGEGYKVFKEGYDDKLDELNKLAQNGHRLIQEYEEELKQQTGINSLKIKRHSSLGFLIEVTKPNLSKVPPNFIRKQTMINAERFITTKLVELNDALINAVEQAILREKILYEHLLKTLLKFKQELKMVAEALATVDVLLSLAYVAKKCFYNKAHISKDGSLELRASRHPVIEAHIGFHKFVPNDIIINPPTKTLLITGPNMAGKSTFMRQIALCAIINQIGGFVPAIYAKLPIFDRIFTRIGASDDLSQGKSTFMLEMIETTNIIRNATPNSLVLLDEVGRGTSTQDGLAIASAVLEDINHNIKAYTLFSTHYHELLKFINNVNTIKLITTNVIKQNDKIVFTHKIIDGSCTNSFGIEVAKLAGLPQRIIDNAQKYLQNILKQKQTNNNTTHSLVSNPMQSNTTNPSIHLQFPVLQSHDHTNKTLCNNNKQNNKLISQPINPLSDINMSKIVIDNTEISIETIKQILKKLITLKIYKTTPIQAINLLDEIQSLLNTSKQRSFFDI